MEGTYKWQKTWLQSLQLGLALAVLVLQTQFVPHVHVRDPQLELVAGVVPGQLYLIQYSIKEKFKQGR